MPVLWNTNNKFGFVNNSPGTTLERITDPVAYNPTYSRNGFFIQGVSANDSWTADTEQPLSEGSFGCTIIFQSPANNFNAAIQLHASDTAATWDTASPGCNCTHPPAQSPDEYFEGLWLSVDAASQMSLGYNTSLGPLCRCSGVASAIPLGEPAEFGADLKRRINVNWKSDAVNGYIRLYIDKVLAVNIEGDTTIYPIQNLRYFTIRMVPNNRRLYSSEFMWSDEGLVGVRQAQLDVSAVGDLTGWNDNSNANVYTQGQVSQGSFTFADSDGLDQSYELTDLNASIVSAGFGISEMWFTGFAREGSTPANFALGTRTEGNDYTGPTVSGISGSFEKFELVYNTNPDSGVDWTATQVNDAQIIAQSRP